MTQQKYMQGHTAASQTRHGSRTVQNTCQYFTQLLNPDMQILDVGCGPGSITSGLAQLVPQGKVIGIDQSEKTLQIARSQVDLPSNCLFQIGDALHTEFADDTFDVVHTSQVLVHLSNSVSALKEFHRILKPGGFIACREGDAETWTVYPEHPGFNVWKRAIIARQADCDPNAGRYLLKRATDAGFEISKCTFSGGTMTYAGSEGRFFGETLAKQVDEDQVYRKTLLDGGVTDEAGLQSLKEAWESWYADPCCVFVMLCGQIVAYK